MGTKEEISAQHARELGLEHGWKKWTGEIDAAITGDARAGSIGERIAVEIRRAGGLVSSYPHDVRQPIVATELRERNTLIMSHGVCHMNWFEEASPDSVAEVMDVNLFGSYNLAAAFVRQTIETNERKKIIMIGSMAHRNVLNASAMYCASKAGLAMLARCMAWELTPKGFDVYCIHPSNVDEAPMAEDTIKGIMRYRGVGRGEALQYWGANYLRDQSLTTKDISDLVLFLLSEKNGYMSGASIELGGGQR